MPIISLSNAGSGKPSYFAYLKLMKSWERAVMGILNHRYLAINNHSEGIKKGVILTP